MLIIVCRNEDGSVSVVVERKTNCIEFTDEEVDVMGVESAFLFSPDMKLVGLMYELEA
jgi:hypothetical protein